MIANPSGLFESPIQHYYTVVQCLVTMKNISFFCTVMGMSREEEQCGCTIFKGK